MQVAQTVLSQDEQEPELRYLPSTHDKQLLSLAQVLQSPLQLRIHVSASV